MSRLLGGQCQNGYINTQRVKTMNGTTMISKASIHNFKCLRDVQIDLERFTIFVGPNASGKSSILQALNLLCRSFAEQSDERGESWLLQAVSRGSTDYVELAAECGGKGYRFRRPLSPFLGKIKNKERQVRNSPVR